MERMIRIIILEEADKNGLRSETASVIGDEVADRLNRLGYCVSKHDRGTIETSTKLDSEDSVTIHVLDTL